MTTTASILATFINEAQFEDLPDQIVRETKRILLDSLGCAVAGLSTEKGKMALSIGQKGGSPESTIVGAQQKVPAPVASFVNGELLNALDYDVLCAPTGHVTPYVLSAPLAVAEWKHVTGKVLILAIAVAHEIAQRVCAGLIIPGPLSAKALDGGLPLQLPIHGYGANVFGGIAGVAKILGLDDKKIENAFGIGGAMCPVPTLMQFAENVPAAMSKFTPSGWVSQAEVTAALYAQMGYTGDRNVFDGDFAFWKSFAAAGWDPQRVVNGLGRFWSFSEGIGYKRYPCCGAMQGALDVFCAIIERFEIMPEDIKEVHIGLNLLAELSLWKNRDIENHIDAQFSTAYVFAVAAHRVEVGHRWQVKETIHAPEIAAFMKKVNVFTPASPRPDQKRSMVEVILWDKDTRTERRYTERDVWPVQVMMTDRDLYRKFEKNTARTLSPRNSGLAMERILSLEALDDVADLMTLFSLS